MATWASVIRLQGSSQSTRPSSSMVIYITFVGAIAPVPALGDEQPRDKIGPCRPVRLRAEECVVQAAGTLRYTTPPLLGGNMFGWTRKKPNTAKQTSSLPARYEG